MQMDTKTNIPSVWTGDPEQLMKVMFKKEQPT